jgi:hypothetical protein
MRNPDKSFHSYESELLTQLNESRTAKIVVPIPGAQLNSVGCKNEDNTSIASDSCMLQISEPDEAIWLTNSSDL